MDTQHLRRGIWLGLILATLGASIISAGQFAGGDGSPASPYQIASPEQWVAFSADPNLWDKHFVLIRDLDMVRVEPNAVQPVGEGGNAPFVGVLDGRGHTIAHLRIVRPDWGLIGTFGQIGGPDIRSEFVEEIEGHVRNLHLRDISVRGIGSVGGLAGELRAGTIRNCSVTGTIEGQTMVGGLVGWAHGPLEACTTAVHVRGRMNVGGLAGDASSHVSGCSSSGRVYGETRVGGLIGTWGGSVFMGGIWESSPIDDEDVLCGIVQCRSDCAVYGTKEIGGLVAAGVGIGRIEDCYALGPVTGEAQMGGLIGQLFGCCVVRCFATGPVKGTEDVGGLIGKSEPVRDANGLEDYPPCQAIIEKMPEADAEGEPRWRLIYRPAILACFCAADSLGAIHPVGLGDDDAAVTPLTAEQMRRIALFRNQGWDFGSPPSVSARSTPNPVAEFPRG